VTNPRHQPNPSSTPESALETVRFDLPTFLSGTTTAWGIFDVELHGSWQDGVFKLDERFVYDDGSVENRVWWVKPVATDRFEARCDDCVGVAAGTCADGVIRMAYVFRLRLPTRVIQVSFDDRLYRVTANTAINRATVSKWGVRLGEITLYFDRQPTAAECNDQGHPIRLAAG
jgi:Protein of unknown function (DUF3833)